MTEKPLCQDVRRLLAEAEDRELGPTERDFLDRHLRDCPACREIAAWIGAVDGLVAQESAPSWSEVEAARLAQRVRARMRPRTRLSFFGAPPVWVAAAALALMLGVLTARHEEPTAPAGRHERGGRSAEIEFHVDGISPREATPRPQRRPLSPPIGADAAAPMEEEALPPGSAEGLREKATSLGSAAASRSGPADATALRQALRQGRPALLLLARRPLAEDLPSSLSDSLRRSWTALLAQDLPDSSRVRLEEALRRLAAGGPRE